jgi:hypothetical protein
VLRHGRPGGEPARQVPLESERDLHSGPGNCAQTSRAKHRHVPTTRRPRRGARRDRRCTGLRGPRAGPHPDPCRHLVHYYGAYSNVARGGAKASGHAAKAQPLAPGPGGEPSPPSPAPAALRRRWAQLIRRIYQVDPLICRRCRGVMRVVSFITQPRLIPPHPETPRRARRARVPPAAAGAVPSSPDPLSSRPPPPRCQGRIETRLDRDLLAPATRLKALERTSTGPAWTRREPSAAGCPAAVPPTSTPHLYRHPVWRPKWKFLSPELMEKGSRQCARRVR